MISAQGADAKHPPKNKHHNRAYYNKQIVPRYNVIRHYGYFPTITSENYYKKQQHAFYPKGTIVKRLPKGTRKIQTRQGVVFKHGKTFYKKSKNGRGYIVMSNPYMRHGRY